MTQSLAVWIGGALVLTLPTAAMAQEVIAAVYHGRQLSIAVASTAGDGFGGYGRLVACHIGKFVAGNPGGVVRNAAAGNTLSSL